MVVTPFTRVGVTIDPEEHITSIPEDGVITQKTTIEKYGSRRAIATPKV
jgi:hypothetical protein